MKRLLILLVVVMLAACGGDADDPIPVEPDGGIGDGAGPPGDGAITADLTITIEHPDADTIEYQLTCGDGAASIDGFEGLTAEAACERLSIPEVQERLISPPSDRVCTEIYGGPDTAHIRGTLDGQDVDTIIDRTNGCGISDWDTLLADVLPPALGVTG